MCALSIQSCEKEESRTFYFYTSIGTVVILNWAFSVDIFFA